MTHTVTLAQIDLVLEDLPPSHITASSGASRLVMGPNGAFVVLPDGDEDLARGAAADRLATTTRAMLAEHLHWVPFVDALLVTPEDCQPQERATVVTLDLLPTVLVDGPLVIDEVACHTVGSLLHAGMLAGWNPGLPVDDGSIDLCDQPGRLHH